MSAAVTTIWRWPDSTIVRVVDGDSVIAQVSKHWASEVDIGFHGSSAVEGTVTFQQRLRLNRINAAPKGTPNGDAARNRTIELTQGVLDITTIKAYKYGDSWMAEIVTADGVNISDQLVTEGLAVYWDGNGARPGG